MRSRRSSWRCRSASSPPSFSSAGNGPEAVLPPVPTMGATCMNRKLTATAIGLSLLAATGAARADGQLNIYNWGDYTSPDLIKKFEQTYKVKVTITDFDSNDTALAKVRQGGAGFDIVVPSASVVPIWISEGLLLETDPNTMENFK